jgi:hypothetical protein
MSTLRVWSSILGAAFVAACGGEGRGGTAGGDAATAEVAALNYEVTPDRYQRWVAAQQALDAIPDMPAPPKIDPMRLDESEIRRAVQYLERNEQARAALARAGITARDYVLTTVALDQALVTASTTPPAPPGAPTATSPPAAGSRPSTASKSAEGSVAPGAALRASPRARIRPRLTGTPPGNVELVRRNRDDVVRVLRTMRFRIAEPTTDDVVDTTITRSDSVTVGKDLTVKWDVTVRRNRDSTGRKPASPDSARRDSTDPD